MFEGIADELGDTEMGVDLEAEFAREGEEGHCLDLCTEDGGDGGVKGLTG
jgi:hypothetical protein